MLKVANRLLGRLGSQQIDLPFVKGGVLNERQILLINGMTRASDMLRKVEIRLAIVMSQSNSGPYTNAAETYWSTSREVRGLYHWFFFVLFRL